MDDLTTEQRHVNMSHIQSKNTKPEMIVRKYLFSKGFRYRVNDKRYPGHPDIVLPKYKTVIFINGCFWHQHPNCKYASIPKTNKEYWIPKLQKNVERDKLNYKKLSKLGWNVIVIWECELKKMDNIKVLQQTLYKICGK
jgi:DNA mismatch endonuclease (patch repair protein)